MNRECVRVVSVCVCVDSLRITSSQSAPTAWFASCHNVRLAGVGLPVSRAVADDDRRGKQSAVVNCFARSMIVSSLNDCSMIVSRGHVQRHIATSAVVISRRRIATAVFQSLREASWVPLPIR